MPMRDLEKASGVSREAIRFYIGEGLLPEPERSHRNSATYTGEHLAREVLGMLRERRRIANDNAKVGQANERLT